MDDGDGAKIDDARGDGGFLGGNDHADAVMALLADCGEDHVGEGGGGGGEGWGDVLWFSFRIFSSWEKGVE